MEVMVEMNRKKLYDEVSLFARWVELRGGVIKSINMNEETYGGVLSSEVAYIMGGSTYYNTIKARME